jgi:paraquat-inducible protein B
MSEGPSAPGASENLPEVVVSKGRGASLVWLVPIVALAIGGFLGLQSYQNRGIEVVIEYPTAEWLEAGKTKIKFRSVEIGTVDKITFKKDVGTAASEGVELHCTLIKEAAPHLTEGSQFWIEHPRVGGGQVSGLGTLLSGAYIVMRGGPPDGARSRRFVGLEEPPVAPEGEKGLRLTLHADERYSIGEGTGVYYLEERVGTVEATKLAADGDGVSFELFIPDEHASLVRKDSRFWNSGGIQISASLGQLDVSTGTLSSMLAGGIDFDSPGKTKSPPAENKASYWLHPTRSDVDTYLYRYGGLRIVVEAHHLGGAKVGDPVSYRELTVGEVISQELTTDSRKLRLHLNIQNRYRNLVRSNSKFWNASGITADLGLTGLHVRAESMQALLAGGIAFATPDSPGHLVKEGSVFKLHPEVKDKWLAWKPVLWRGPAKKDAKTDGDASGSETEKKKDSPGVIARFFHHENKDEDEAAKDAEVHKDPEDHEAHHEKKHGHLKRR